MFTENLLFYKEESLIMAFIDTIKERAKADKKTIVLPESMRPLYITTFRMRKVL